MDHIIVLPLLATEHLLAVFSSLKQVNCLNRSQ